MCRFVRILWYIWHIGWPVGGKVRTVAFVCNMHVYANPGIACTCVPVAVNIIACIQRTRTLRTHFTFICRQFVRFYVRIIANPLFTWPHVQCMTILSICTISTCAHVKLLCFFDGFEWIFVSIAYLLTLFVCMFNIQTSIYYIYIYMHFVFAYLTRCLWNFFGRAERIRRRGRQ